MDPWSSADGLRRPSGGTRDEYGWLLVFNDIEEYLRWKGLREQVVSRLARPELCCLGSGSRLGHRPVNVGVA
jgi:hypothetical protein